MNNLKYFRTRAGLTGPELAERSGVDAPRISRVERGFTDLPGNKWASLADVLDCTVDELIGRVKVGSIKSI